MSVLGSVHFEATVSRYVASLRAKENQSIGIASYWRGRGDEYAEIYGVAPRRAYKAAQALLENESDSS